VLVGVIQEVNGIQEVAKMTREERETSLETMRGLTRAVNRLALAIEGYVKQAEKESAFVSDLAQRIGVSNVPGEELRT